MIGGRTLTPFTSDRTRPGELAVVDPATGLARHELGACVPIGEDGANLVVGRQSPDARRAWFAVLEPGATRVRMLGAVDGAFSRCHAGHRSVLCVRAGDDTVALWRYR